MSGYTEGSSPDIGGIAAQNNKGTIINCYNTGNVISSNTCGGIVGTNDGNISYCYNLGIVTGDSYVGGITSYNSASVICCYNAGVVNGTKNAAIGVLLVLIIKVLQIVIMSAKYRGIM